MTTLVNAQTTSGNITKQTNVVYGTGGTGAIKVVDNKGTVKYLQAQNGMTVFTNTTNDVTTTTWQLGGTLTDNTYIDVNGKTFGLDKLTLVTDVNSASTDATTASTHGTGTGFTVLIRDEATGAVQKIKLLDLLNVTAGHAAFAIDGTVYAAGTTAISLDVAYGTTTIPILNVNKVSVYRNGAKLVATTDYTVDTASPKQNYVKVTPVAADWQFFTNDVIEVHWIK
ncbi:MAG: hypothetical protein JZU53_01550 [Paludibacter sp.]|nr:hypothetical protein [Paludibacter sp.]